MVKMLLIGFDVCAQMPVDWNRFDVLVGVVRSGNVERAEIFMSVFCRHLTFMQFCRLLTEASSCDDSVNMILMLYKHRSVVSIL